MEDAVIMEEGESSGLGISVGVGESPLTPPEKVFLKSVRDKGKGKGKGLKRPRSDRSGSSGPPFRTKVGAVGGGGEKRTIVQDSRTQSSITWLGAEPKKVMSEGPIETDPSDPDLEEEEVVDLIQCGICYRGFSGHVDPRASPCGHLLCLDCLEGLERAAVPIRAGPKILSCPTCRRLCEKKDFLKLTLSGKSVISSRPQVIIAEELEKVKNTLLNPIIACALEWVEQESERLELVPQIITTNNMIGQLPKFINNFETEARVVKAVAIRNKTRDAINRLDRLIGQLYLQQGVAVCLCVGACQCGGRAPTSKRP